jgi:hypothetical protein
MFRPHLLLMLGVALTACGPQALILRQSAVVPHVPPPSWGGQTVPERFGLGLRSSTLVLPPDLFAQPGRQSGVYVAQSEAELELRLRLWNRLELAALGDVAFDQTARPTTDGVAPRPNLGPAAGFGFGSRFTFLEGPFQIGMGLDLLLYSLPVHSESDSGAWTGEERQLVGVYAFSLLPSYRPSSLLTMFAGVTLRNHPDILKSTAQELYWWQQPTGASPGPMNVVVSAGVSYRPVSLVLIHAQLYQNIGDQPVAYRAPGVDVGVTLLLADAPSPPAAGPPPPR